MGNFLRVWLPTRPSSAVSLRATGVVNKHLSSLGILRRDKHWMVSFPLVSMSKVLRYSHPRVCGEENKNHPFVSEELLLLFLVFIKIRGE